MSILRNVPFDKRRLYNQKPPTRDNNTTKEIREIRTLMPTVERRKRDKQKFSNVRVIPDCGRLTKKKICARFELPGRDGEGGGGVEAGNP